MTSRNIPPAELDKKQSQATDTINLAALRYKGFIWMETCKDKSRTADDQEWNIV